MRHIIVNTTYPGTQLKMPNHLIQETNRYITALCESFGFDSYTCISSQDPSEIQPEHIGSPWRHVVLDDLLDPNPETGFFSKTMKNLTKTLNVAPDDTVMLASPYNDVIAKEDYEFILDTHAANLDKIIVGARKINGNHHPSMLINVCDADRVKKGFCLHAKRSESPWRAFLDKSTLISFPLKKMSKEVNFCRLCTRYRIT